MLKRCFSRPTMWNSMSSKLDNMNMLLYEHVFCSGRPHTIKDIYLICWGYKNQQTDFQPFYNLKIVMTWHLAYIVNYQ